MILKHELSNDDCEAEKMLVFRQLVPKLRAQAFEILEASVDGFMTGASIVLCPSIRQGHPVLRDADFFITPVASVGFNLFVWKKPVLESTPENLYVRPFSTRKWAIDPDNVTCLDAGSNLISNPCTIELVTVPFLVKRQPRVVRFWRLPNRTVGAVDIGQARTSIIPLQSIFPTNLLRANIVSVHVIIVAEQATK
jgi:hypothetical protein